MNFTPYHAKYFAYELTKRSSSDSIHKLAATLLDVPYGGLPAGMKEADLGKKSIPRNPPK